MVFSQQSSILFRERAGAMMLLLALYTAQDGRRRPYEAGLQLATGKTIHLGPEEFCLTPSDLSFFALPNGSKIVLVFRWAGGNVFTLL